MKRLSKEKKQQLMLVVVGTVAVLVGLWYGLINWQQDRLLKMEQQKEDSLAKLDHMKTTLKRAGEIESELETKASQLSQAEAKMASGDLYAWFINTLRDFKTGYDVDIPQFGNIIKSDTSLLPKFPYQQATLAVAGTAHYCDLGHFIADFENQFPYIRILNLELEPDRTANAAPEKLAFRMDIVAPVKPES